MKLPPNKTVAESWFKKVFFLTSEVLYDGRSSQFNSQVPNAVFKRNLKFIV